MSLTGTGNYKQEWNGSQKEWGKREKTCICRQPVSAGRVSDRIGVWTYPRKVTGWACWLQRSRKRIDELDVESERGLPTKQCTTAATATQIERETQ